MIPSTPFEVCTLSAYAALVLKRVIGPNSTMPDDLRLWTVLVINSRRVWSSPMINLRMCFILA